MPNEDIIIQKFTKDVKYDQWRRSFMLLAKFKKCSQVFETEQKPQETKQEDWENWTNRMMYYLSIAVPFDDISDCENPKQVIDKLDSVYMKKSEAKQIMIEKQLYDLKLKEGDDPVKFFETFERKILELKNAGSDITRKKKLSFLMHCLPSSCDHLIDLIDALPEEQRTCDYIREKLLLRKTMTSKESTSAIKEEEFSQAFKTSVKIKDEETKNSVCYGCGKSGHIRKYCYSNSRNNNGSSGYRGRGQGGRYNSGHNSGSYRGNFRGNYHRNYNRSGNHHRGSFRGGYLNRRDHQSFPNSNQQANIIEGGNIEMSSLSAEVHFNQKDEGNLSNELLWVLDSGCTDHIVNDDKYFYSFVNLKNPVSVKVGNNECVMATKVGKIMCDFNGHKANVTNIFYTKEMGKNLLSCSALTSKGNKIIFDRDFAKVYNTSGNMILQSEKMNKLYWIKCTYDKNYTNNVSVNYINMNRSNKEIWHRILGHCNFNDLGFMSKNRIVEGLPNLENVHLTCEYCIENKLNRLPFKNNRYHAKYVGEIIHSDVKYSDVVGPNSENYFVTFIDDYSKLAMVYIIKTKADVLKCLMSYVNFVETNTGNKVKELKCDSGTEYLNQGMKDFAAEKGFRIRPSPAYCHQLNGVAERYNRTIMERARCLRREANLPKIYWPELIKAACYIGNRLLHRNTTEKLTPYEIFTGRKPHVGNMKLYGSEVYYKVPECHRSTQDSKGKKGKLVGYTEDGYRILSEDGKIVISRDVRFIDDTSCIRIGDNDSDSEKGSEVKEFNTESDNEGKENSDEKKKQRPVRERKPPVRYGFDEYVVSVNYASITDVPENYQEAIESPEANEWLKAMNEEIKCVNELETWCLVEKPINQKVLDVKWIYKKKSNGTYRARLVVKGYQQNNLEEEVYSPVMKLGTLRSVLVYGLQRGYHIHQMDAVTAFLNSNIKSEVYINQPEGFSDKTERVFLLKKSLYGLKEAPRNWYECFDKFIKSLGFEKSLVDNCLYRRKDGTICLLFVDDLLLFSADLNRLDKLKEQIKNRFRMKDLKNLTTYLGIDIEYKENKLELSQEKYIKKIAKKFNAEASNVKFTPMEEGLRVEKGLPNDSTEYRSLIGALLYVATATRPDISYAVGYLSRFQNYCTEELYKYAIRVLVYLYHSKEKKLIYRKLSDDSPWIEGYVDADWAGDINDSKSTTGYILFQKSCPVIWRSVKQKNVSRSSTFAEYYALADCVEEVLFVKEILNFLKVDCDKEIKIYEDNASTIQIAKNGSFTKKSRHIRVAVDFIKDLIEKKEISVEKIAGEVNPADILTKPLGKVKFLKFRDIVLSTSM